MGKNIKLDTSVETYVENPYVKVLCFSVKKWRRKSQNTFLDATLLGYKHTKKGDNIYNFSLKGLQSKGECK